MYTRVSCVVRRARARVPVPHLRLVSLCDERHELGEDGVDHGLRTKPQLWQFWQTTTLACSWTRVQTTTQACSWTRVQTTHFSTYKHQLYKQIWGLRMIGNRVSAQE